MRSILSRYTQGDSPRPQVLLCSSISAFLARRSYVALGSDAREPNDGPGNRARWSDVTMAVFASFQDLRFCRSASGKPFLSGQEQLDPRDRIHFNITHSNSIIGDDELPEWSPTLLKSFLTLHTLRWN